MSDLSKLFPGEEKGFVAEENKQLRKTIQRITQRIADCLSETDFTGLQIALDIIVEECGVSVEEILEPKCK